MMVKLPLTGASAMRKLCMARGAWQRHRQRVHDEGIKGEWCALGSRSNPLTLAPSTRDQFDRIGSHSGLTPLAADPRTLRATPGLRRQRRQGNPGHGHHQALTIHP